MSQELVRNQYVISLRNGMVAYIVADNLQDIAGALQTNKFFNTKEKMLVNTADIVAIMSPSEYEDQKKYVRGWYKDYRGFKWHDKKGEYVEDTDLGDSYRRAKNAIEEIDSKEKAVEYLDKLSRSISKDLILKDFGEKIKLIEHMAHEE